VEQVGQRVPARPVGLVRPLGRVGGGLAEHLAHEGVERGVGHACLDEPLGLGLERLAVGERQPEGVARGLHGTLGVLGVPDAETRHVSAQGGGLGVRTHDTNRRDQDAERNRAVVAVERRDVQVNLIGAAHLERIGKRHGDKPCRPPRRDPAVSNTAPDWAARVFRNAAWSSFCIGVYPDPTTPRASGVSTLARRVRTDRA